MFCLDRARQRVVAFVLFCVVLGLLLTAPTCEDQPTLSPLATDLAALVTQGQAADAQLAGIKLSVENSCTELGAVSTSVADWLAAMERVYAGVNTTFSVDLESLTSLGDLSALAVSVAGHIESLSSDLTDLSRVSELVEYEASLAAMLRLSGDIGAMADRIGAMADRILVMADNIGIMADRILITQQLQNTNVMLTQKSILITQQNIVALSDTISTVVYEPVLSRLLTQANALAISMDLASLGPLNMASELARIEDEVGLYGAQVVDLYDRATQDSALASYYINGDTLALCGDLSDIHRLLALSLQTYANAVNQLAPLTSTPVLADATSSMLRLASDIRIMSNRIMEMVDRIMVMADNIGFMRSRMVDTQKIQQTNVESTDASLRTATNTIVKVIATYGL